MRKNLHALYYVVEMAILAVGFYLIAVYSASVLFQISLLIIMLLIYSIMGILHHARSHDIHPRIVLEYVLISLFVLSIFLFMKGNIL